MDSVILPSLAFIFGTIIGSFLNVCIYRLPQETSIVFPGSHCPRCGQPIRFYDNIPLLSYLILAGKCRYCRASISFQYFLVEMASGIFSLLVFLHFSLSEYFVYFGFIASLLVVTGIDLKHKIIPDVISLPGIVIGFACSFVLPRITYVDSLLGIALGGGTLLTVSVVYYAVTKTEGMGGGDIKLLAMIGAFLGPKAVVAVIFISSCVGSLIGIGIILLKGKDRKYAIPFGPFLALGAVIFVFWGDALLNWYQRFLLGE
ncbi:MAG TPA: prepilin peptidase [Thermodesulfobacteriota bacterium]|nr:prepilin peptidase [Deltaproteobacteria bacterium]HNR14379.1 prepilin peptidase [Thermodesulfobacteriota bacterium]HNU70725.1 prepilin peptidase [Thermodesulfobacteriota bacterium]HOC38554.1 prepilin peptidase [Thermodesulfobacteriota bacterium]HQO76876.1 prepilin peptidase [Thermodesulfobacteriota bacterium]